MDSCRRASRFGPGFMLPLAVLFALLFVALGWRSAFAQEPGVSPDSACILCHVGNDETVVLPSGEELVVGIDLAQLNGSVHGEHAEADVSCTDCHGPKQRYLYPHIPTDAPDRNACRADVAQSCENCHVSSELHNPGHLNADLEIDPPNCVDCHGGHAVEPADLLYAAPTAFCQSCHAVADIQDDQTRWAHENIVGKLTDDQSCRTCHADSPQPVSQQCATCHSLLDDSVERTTSPDEIQLHVAANVVEGSVHGNRLVEGVAYPPLVCTECHVQMGEAGFPHPPELLVDRETLRASVEEQCIECHSLEGGQFADGIHAERAAEGKLNAASCADCHGSHDIQQPNEPRTRVSDTCGTCHEEIFTQYKTSVHGEALYGEDNPDVPVCTDCHDAHQIDDPTTAAFRLSSPEMCGKCHADDEKMAKYDISTDVFDTYVADFHGTTVTLFAHESSNEPTNKVVCYDCHGVHDIQSVSDATEAELQVRLLETCRECHPDASENFSASWMSHYTPSLEHYPAVYLVDIFYKILIPTVLGGFMLFIGSDVFRRVSDRYVARRNKRRQS